MPSKPKQLFTLEALKAKHGDSLILHYGDLDEPRFVVIDGGPRGVYKKFLKPRLLQIRDHWNADAALPLQMVMVSHIDDDHVKGILELADDLLSGEGNSFCEILCLWHNSFDDVLGNSEEDLFSKLSDDVRTAAAGAAPVSPAGIDRYHAAVVANVNQGRDLRRKAEELGLEVNDPFEGLVMAEQEQLTRFDWGDGMRLTVLGPSQERLQKLHHEWNKVLEKEGKAAAMVAAYKDNSAFNLSSIVILAELGGKTMLLTGDARGDFILEGLQGAGLLDDSPLHVNLLKMPHHGSHHNLDTDFFEKITADHYVISGDGGYGNPEEDALKMLVDSRQDDDFTLWLTYRAGREGLKEKLDKFLAERKKNKRTFGVEFCPDDALSMKIDLLAPVTY